MTDGPLLYLATSDLLPSCAVPPQASPNPPDSGGEACRWPVTGLEQDGILITIYTTRILVPLPTAGGAQIALNGAPARLMTDTPGSCSGIGADETLDVLVPNVQPTPWSNIGVIACLRGPDVAVAETQVEALLSSLSVPR